MCGRYTLRRLDAEFYGITENAIFEDFIQHPRFNIAPGQDVAVIRVNAKGERVLGLVRWGLIPYFTKGTPKIQPINAKSETVATSGMFRQAMERRRCLVPADGFYEWRGDKPPKQPYFIHMKDDGAFAFAGLWERWKPDEQAEPVDTFTIITTEPNELMRPIHNRMPVILAREDYGRWLAKDNKASDVADLLKSFPAEPMEAWPVSTRVNAPKNEGPELIEVVTDKPHSPVASPRRSSEP